MRVLSYVRNETAEFLLHLPNDSSNFGKSMLQRAERMSTMPQYFSDLIYSAEIKKPNLEHDVLFRG